MKNKNDAVKAETVGRGQAVLAWKGEYEEGDKITFSFPEKNRFYIIRVDDTVGEAFIYGAGDIPVYEVPSGEGRTPYSPKSLTGERHCLTMCYARDYEIKSYRSLTKNIVDQHKSQECCSHTHANVETRGGVMLVVRSAIDGVTANLSHGEWPYESWGTNMKDGVQMTLEFGRPVDFSRIVLYTRADFSRDSWWEKVIFTPSDGTSEVMELEKNVRPHIVRLEYKGITWSTFGQFIRADDPPSLPALTQIGVYGCEYEAAL